MPSANRINLSGVDIPIVADLAPSFGITADATYARASNLFDSSQHIDLLSYVAGPTLYPFARHRYRFFLQGLVGGARVAGGIPNTFESGYVNKFSWGFGGGIEYRLSEIVAWRSGVVYQKTSFYDSNLTIRGQNDFRFVTSLVFSVWQHPNRRYVDSSFGSN
jgi:hypothetical protein